MKIGIMISFHYANEISRAMLKVAIDSIRHFISKEQYEVLIVVDDCSPTASEWESYVRWLSANDVLVYVLGPPRRPYWHSLPDSDKMIGGGNGTSFGHAIGIMAGFYKLKSLGCTHAWVLDGDCWLVDGEWLDDALKMFRYDKVAVVTDYFGGRPSEHGFDLICNGYAEASYDRRSDQVVGSKIKYEVPINGAQWILGFPNLFCAIVDLGVEEQFGNMENKGWVNPKWGKQLFKQGYRVGYFPFFQGRHVFHLGYSFTRQNTGNLKRAYGNVTLTDRYGGKTTGIYHAGYLQTNKTTDEIDAWLASVARNGYDVPALVDPLWLCDPPSVERHGRGDPYLRPFIRSDLKSLCEIDQDPECTRFMQWGPHGEDQTRKFLDKAVSNPDRWFALISGEELAGFGEISPEPGSNVCAFTYVISRKHWHKEFAKYLIVQLHELAYSTYGYTTFIVRIDIENENAKKALLSSGCPEWRMDQTEDYILKGQQRKRWVFVDYHTSVGFATDWVAPSREKVLFEEHGIWR